MLSSIKLSESEVLKLKERIRLLGLKEAEKESRYEELRVNDDGTLLILYKSGKLVHNNSQLAEDIVSEVISGRTVYDLFLGADEAGKGEWYGPLVVACFAVSKEKIPLLRECGVRDSKKLKKKKINELAEYLMEHFSYSKLILAPKTYNRLYSEMTTEKKKLNDLLAWAHSRNIRNFIPKLNYRTARLTIDCFDSIKMEQRLPGLSDKKIKLIQKTNAESEPEVAAASIIAKYFFEGWVNNAKDLFGLDLREIKPSCVDPKLLPEVAKLHFRNVYSSFSRSGPT